MTEVEQERHYHEDFSAMEMSAEQMAEFLAGPDATCLLKLAYFKSDGWPMVIPLVYQWDGEAFLLVGRKGMVVHEAWVESLRREPRCAVCVEEMPRGSDSFRKVMAQCTAEVVGEASAGEDSPWLPVAEEMAARYIGPEGLKHLRMAVDWDRYLVRLVPRDGLLLTWEATALRFFDPGAP